MFFRDAHRISSSAAENASARMAEDRKLPERLHARTWLANRLVVGMNAATRHARESITSKFPAAPRNFHSQPVRPGLK
jgi:hypothetical protein